MDTGASTKERKKPSSRKKKPRKTKPKSTKSKSKKKKKNKTTKKSKATEKKKTKKRKRGGFVNCGDTVEEKLAFVSGVVQTTKTRTDMGGSGLRAEEEDTAFKNVDIMMRNRKYTTITPLYYVYTAPLTFKQTQVVAFSSAKDERGKPVLCVLLRNKTKSVITAEHCLVAIAAAFNPKKIIVLLSKAIKLPKNIVPGVRTDVFLTQDHMWNISDAVPLHEKLSDEEFEAIGTGAADDVSKMNVEKFPMMVSIDAQARYWGFRPGDIVRIHTVPLSYMLVV